MKRNIISCIAAVFIAVFGFSTYALANAEQNMNARQMGAYMVREGEIVDGSYYAAGDNITIAGIVKGDVYCAGQSVTITGVVEGDVICAAQTIALRGDVRGDVRAAAQTVTYNGSVDGSVSTFAQTITLNKEARISGDLNGAAQDILLSGVVGRDIFMAAETMTINGAVGRNVSGAYDQLSTNSGAVVGGDVHYTSENDAVIADGTVAGISKRTAPPVNEDTDSSTEMVLGAALYTFASLLIVSLAVSLVAPQLLHTVSEHGAKRLLASLLAGFFVVFGTPIIAILLAVTIIGLPLAGLLILSWLVILILSGPVFGYFLGRKIMQRSTANSVLVMAVGASVLLISYFIPVANIFAILAAGTFGSGMIILELSRRYKKPTYKVKG